MARSYRRGRPARVDRNNSTLLSSRTAYEQYNDLMLTYNFPASLVNGVYTFIGKETAFQTQSELGLASIAAAQPQPSPSPTPLNFAPLSFINPNFGNPNMTQQDMLPHAMEQEMMMRENLMISQAASAIPLPPLQDPMTTGYGSPIQQANISLYGIKTRPSNTLCSVVTYIASFILIFPMFFAYCMWWKRIVFPTYELSVEAYKSVARLIAKAPNMNTLNLTVVDNAFNAQKARILHQALSSSRISTFNFTNSALNSNGEDNEASNFRQNIMPIKSLNMKTSFVWADMEF